MSSTSQDQAGYFAEQSPSPTSRRSSLLPALLPLAIVLVVYVWLISVGTWTHWPGRWYSYDELATSFRQGRLFLPQKPDPALLALPNPYDPAARQGMSFLQDASLYNGRYYLYFGPVPALILAPIKTFVAARVGDHILVFAFASGILILISALLLVIRERYFPRSPAWILSLAILTAGLVNPLPWILNTPSVYNAAITAGQFFFLAGFAAAYISLTRQPVSVAGLALAGLLWAAAVGSRITQVVPIAFMVFLTLATTLIRHRRAGSTAGAVAPGLALLLTLAGGLMLLGWYDWARFGSVFETGVKYQLAGIPLQEYGSRIYSASYLAQNLYNYWLNLPALKHPFPYFNPVVGSTTSVLPWLHLSRIYQTQEVTGLLYTAPWLLLAVLPVAGLFWPRLLPPSTRPEDQSLRWLILALAGSFLFGAAFFLVFFWAAERYMLDFIPALMLLSFIGLWQLDELLRSKPRLRFLIRAILAVLMLASILLSLLLSMTFNADGFRHLNPVLWRQLGNLFRP